MSIAELTKAQRRVFRDLNLDSTTFLNHVRDIEIAYELESLDLVEVDAGDREDAAEVGVTLTEAGEELFKSLE